MIALRESAQDVADTFGVNGVDTTGRSAQTMKAVLHAKPTVEEMCAFIDVHRPVRTWGNAE
jgi:hypothetical protein